MNSKRYAVCAWASSALFWVTYFLMSSIRTDYLHKTKAVSELGSVGASNGVIWNVLGFITVGLLISVFSLGLHKSISTSGKGRVAFVLLFASGIFWAFAGVFPGDFDDKSSLTMILHAVGAMGSGLFFVLSVFSYVPAMKASTYWRAAIAPSLTLGIAFILSGFLRVGSAPALGQKVGFAIFFVWLCFMAYKLYKTGANKSSHSTADSA